MKHRMTIQFDARLAFDLNLPPDDAALIRDQTLVSVVVDRAADDGVDRRDCCKFILKIRVGDDDETAIDYEQANFVHESAATGAASCVLQYLMAKERLNVAPAVVGPSPLGLETSHHPSFVPVGWKLAKIEKSRVVAAHAEHVRR